MFAAVTRGWWEQHRTAGVARRSWLLQLYPAGWNLIGVFLIIFLACPRWLASFFRFKKYFLSLPWWGLFGVLARVGLMRRLFSVFAVFIGSSGIDSDTGMWMAPSFLWPTKTQLWCNRGAVGRQVRMKFGEDTVALATRATFRVMGI